MPAPAVLITGATGFVGRHLLNAIAADLPSAAVIPVSRRQGVKLGDQPVRTLDPTQPDSIAPLLKSTQPDIVFHLAGEAFGPRAAADPMQAWRSNFWQTLELAENVRTTLPNCVFVFVSTSDVYGLSIKTGEPATESLSLSPANAYGATKAAIDLALGEMALRGLRVIRLRPFNHTGPGQSASYVIPTLARQIAMIEAGQLEPVIRTGNLDSARDFLDVRDVCAGYVKLIAQAQSITPGEAFNIASSTPRRISDILQKLLQLSGVDAKVESEAGRLRPNEVRSVCGDASKFQQRLDWQPTIPFDQTLSDTLAWWRDQIRPE